MLHIDRARDGSGRHPTKVRLRSSGPRAKCAALSRRLAIFEFLPYTRKGNLLKVTHLAMIGAFVLVGVAQAGEDRAVARACKADAEHMCAGKTGQELQQCLKSNQEKLSSNCKDAISKLPPKS